MPESLAGEHITLDYFDVAGTRPRSAARSRTDDVPNAPRVVILSHGLWMRRFGGDPRIVGTSLRSTARATR
jgi:hypothetical protein